MEVRLEIDRCFNRHWPGRRSDSRTSNARSVSFEGSLAPLTALSLRLPAPKTGCKGLSGAETEAWFDLEHEQTLHHCSHTYAQFEAHICGTMPPRSQVRCSKRAVRRAKSEWMGVGDLRTIAVNAPRAGLEPHEWRVAGG